jgi:uncharacterized protein with HEPN domain
MNDNAILRRIINYCAEIESDRTRFGDSLDDFLEDRSYQRSCCMNLLQIGESVRKLSDEFKAKNDEIDWTAVIGFRNLVAHRYEALNDARIWEIITEDVPKLLSTCEMLI